MRIGHDALALDDEAGTVPAGRRTGLPGLQEILLLDGDIDFNDGLAVPAESGQDGTRQTRQRQGDHRQNKRSCDWF